MGSIRFDAAGDSLSRGRLAGAKTVMAWIYLAVDRNDYSCVFGLNENELISTGADGVTLIHYDGSIDRTGATLSVGAWYHLAYTSDGDALTSGFSIYLNGVAVITSAARSVVISGATMFLGNDAYGEWLNGRMAHVKIWAAALTQTEVQQEMVSIRPHRLANIHSWLPTVDTGTGRSADYAGQGNGWTANGTLTDEDGPPVGWGAPVWVVPFVVGGSSVTVAVAVDGIGVVDPAVVVGAVRSVAVAVAVDGIGLVDPSVTVATTGNVAVAAAVDVVGVVDPAVTVAAARSVAVAVAVDVIGVVDPAAVVGAVRSVAVAVAADVIGVVDPAVMVAAARSVAVAAAVDGVGVSDPSVTVMTGGSVTVAAAVDVIGVVDPAVMVAAARSVAVAAAVDVIGVVDPAVVVVAGVVDVTVGVAQDVIGVGQPSAGAIVVMVVALTARRGFGLSVGRGFGLSVGRDLGLSVDRER